MTGLIEKLEAAEGVPLDLMTVQNIEGLRRAYERLHEQADGRLGSQSMREMAASRTEYQAALMEHGRELISTALHALKDQNNG